MHHRPFAPGVSVSEIGLGCWQFSGSDWGDVSEDSALRTMAAAMDGGVTFFDTADVYGGGRSEQLIGKFIRSGGRRPFIASKLGRKTLWDLPDIWSLAGLRRLTEDSLTNLGVDCLDLMQLHCVPMARMKSAETWGWLETLRQEGKIRFYGASVESVEEALVCLRQPGCRSLQVIFNIFRQKPAEELFAAAARQGVAIVVRLPLASGLLSGRITAATTFAKEDHRSYNRDGDAFNVGETFAGLGFDRGVELSHGLQKAVPGTMTMAAMALRWCLDFPEITALIPGASRPEQATQNCRASAAPPLSPVLHWRLRHYYQAHVATHIRGPY